MNFEDPFAGYSLLLRLIVYGLIPAFAVVQYLRLRRGLHVFQLEGYKRARFLDWCRANPGPARFMRPIGTKKPLVMTGRAWRILLLATFLSAAASVVLPGMMHLLGGAPYDLATWGVVTVLLFYGAPSLLTAADWLLTPVQATINRSFEKRALDSLARVGPTVIGVTGSFGKTSTKFAIARLLGPSEVAFATPGSYNTPMGVVRAINEGLDGTHRYIVVEMGAYREGDIAALCELVRPEVAVLTAIGPAHLERFGSIEAIRRAKYEIVTSLGRGGTAVMNVDDAQVRELADSTGHVEVVRYGFDPAGAPNVTARDVAIGPDGTTFTILDADGGSLAVRTRLVGAYSVGHILAGVAVARRQGIALDEIGPRIEALEPVEHRLQLLTGAGGVTIIDDAFNSNPAGAAAALDVLAGMPGNKKVVVTPGIVELGELQAQENERFAATAASIADVLIVVGRTNRDALVRGAASADDVAEVIVVDRLEEATQRLSGLLSPGDVVLFENDLPDQYEL